jgi:acyl carrier protein
MYNFLEHKGMPLTLRGTFIAYKGVSLDLWSICGNKDTVVVHGQVNASGQILNTIGATIEVERSSVDDDFRQGCSAGLHVGSLAYARDWGKRVILVEVDPIDVVSVPSDCNCQKLRCCKYTVVGEYSGPMPDTLTTEFDSTEDDVCHQCGNPIDDCSCDDTEDNDTEYESTPNALWLAPSAINIPSSLNTSVSIPPKPDVYKRVIDILVDNLGLSDEEKSRLDFNTKVNYDSLGVDSLDGVELCMAFEEEFGIEISDEAVEKYIDCTIGQIVKDISDHMAKTGNPLIVGALKQHYDVGFADGKTQKLIDLGMNRNTPKYLIEDVDGSDSDAHAAYIKGYVAAYIL